MTAVNSKLYQDWIISIFIRIEMQIIIISLFIKKKIDLLLQTHCLVLNYMKNLKIYLQNTKKIIFNQKCNNLFFLIIDKNLLSFKTLIFTK